MLKEVIKRPLLCLRKELYNRMEWRIIIICPVCSPTVFMEMRSLLHFWFQGTYMIISFPVWFSFATALLFYREGSHDSLSETLSKEPTAESISDVSLVQRAAFYLSWVLCPSNDDQCEMLSNNILEISHSWARNNKKCLSYQITMNHRRKLQIPTAAKSEKFHVPINTLLLSVNPARLENLFWEGRGSPPPTSSMRFSFFALVSVAVHVSTNAAHCATAV
ncbi:hypothetical protein ZEAMMB73_Zm00001d036176 [Zea mays]|uniref:Uncharacterized protein n=1 Tax=Zea mays TaxID=4577 RepID=A0A1D6LL43_MAIZE|nr:hypothetical protein ZEAMMB73_Zm00001d036176 [Zea mays]